MVQISPPLIYIYIYIYKRVQITSYLFFFFFFFRMKLQVVFRMNAQKLKNIYIISRYQLQYKLLFYHILVEKRSGMYIWSPQIILTADWNSTKTLMAYGIIQTMWDKIALFPFQANYIALCSPSQTNQRNAHFLKLDLLQIKFKKKKIETLQWHFKESIMTF